MQRRTMLDYIHGRWSTAVPRQPGVYALRSNGHSWVAYFDPGPQSTFTARNGVEYLYLAGDADGAPTRWDDERVAREATSRGWRPAPTTRSGAARR